MDNSNILVVGNYSVPRIIMYPGNKIITVHQDSRIFYEHKTGGEKRTYEKWKKWKTLPRVYVVITDWNSRVLFLLGGVGVRM